MSEQVSGRASLPPWVPRPGKDHPVAASLRTGSGLARVGQRTRRALLAWSALWFGVMVWQGGTSWHYFVEGQQALADLDDRLAGGLHLYAALPYLQIGPVAFLAASLATAAGTTAALVLAQVFGAACGLAVLLVLRGIAERMRPELGQAELDRRLLSVALFFTPVWTFLAVGVTHLDDVLALLFVVLAVRAAATGRPVLTGVLVGLAVDSKPWAVPFAALLLMVPGWRRRAAGAAAVLLVVLVVWAPFFLADPQTVRAVHYTIPNTALSALRVLGVDDPRTPGWTRPAQVVLGLGLGVLAVRRRRWAAVVLVVVASRMVLDPGTNRYYVAGLVTGAAVWDLLGARSRLPWWSAAACLGLWSSRWLGLPSAGYGTATLCFFVAACLLATNWPGPRAASPIRRARRIVRVVMRDRRPVPADGRR